MTVFATCSGWNFLTVIVLIDRSALEATAIPVRCWGIRSAGYRSVNSSRSRRAAGAEKGISPINPLDLLALTASTVPNWTLPSLARRSAGLRVRKLDLSPFGWPNSSWTEGTDSINRAGGGKIDVRTSLCSVRASLHSLRRTARIDEPRWISARTVCR
jgi:hypothetical protein